MHDDIDVFIRCALERMTSDRLYNAFIKSQKNDRNYFF